MSTFPGVGLKMRSIGLPQQGGVLFLSSTRLEYVETFPH
jgi:hypothetical protein